MDYSLSSSCTNRTADRLSVCSNTTDTISNPYRRVLDRDMLVNILNEYNIDEEIDVKGLYIDRNQPERGYFLLVGAEMISVQDLRKQNEGSQTGYFNASTYITARANLNTELVCDLRSAYEKVESRDVFMTNTIYPESSILTVSGLTAFYRIFNVIKSPIRWDARMYIKGFGHYARNPTTVGSFDDKSGILFNTIESSEEFNNIRLVSSSQLDGMRLLQDFCVEKLECDDNHSLIQAELKKLIRGEDIDHRILGWSLAQGLNDNSVRYLPVYTRIKSAILIFYVCKNFGKFIIRDFLLSLKEDNLIFNENFFLGWITDLTYGLFKGPSQD